eukprot:4405653-Prymnesium_polylepis.1
MDFDDSDDDDLMLCIQESDRPIPSRPTAAPPSEAPSGDGGTSHANGAFDEPSASAAPHAAAPRPVAPPKAKAKIAGPKAAAVAYGAGANSEAAAQWHAQLSKGSRVTALDVREVWCKAVVTKSRGEGRDKEFKVHYEGWNARWDEWLR